MTTMGTLSDFYEEQYDEKVLSRGDVSFTNRETGEEVKMALLANTDCLHTAYYSSHLKLNEIIIHKVHINSQLHTQLRDLKLRYTLFSWSGTVSGKAISREICVIADKYAVLEKEAFYTDIKIPIYDHTGKGIESFIIKETTRK